MAPAPDGASALALGIDLGGTKIAAGVVDASGRILGRGHRLTQPQEGWEAVVDRMVAAGEEALAQAGVAAEALAGVGIGSPGPVNPETGVDRKSVVSGKSVDLGGRRLVKGNQGGGDE